MKRFCGPTLIRCKRLFSNGEIVSAIPSNLKLADVKVLEEPLKPLIPDIEYIFPPLRSQVPKSIEVKAFQQPNESNNIFELNSTVFGVAIRKDIVHECIRYLRHKRRQPKKTKRKGDIRGSNKKPRPQKGGGQSQAGHKRNSVWRGGQKAHGPVIRSYAIGLNRKMRALGMMMVLSAKLREGNLVVFDKFETKTIKTKETAQLMRQHGFENIRTLMIDVELNTQFMTSVKNISTIKAVNQIMTNVYDVVRSEKLAITVDALRVIQTRLISQYNHHGKRKSYNTKLSEYKRLVTIGATE